MTAKFDKFKTALLDLCNDHKVKIFPGFSDGPEVCDSEIPLIDLGNFELIDCTKKD